MRDLNKKESTSVSTARLQRPEQQATAGDTFRAPLENLAETNSRTASLGSPFVAPRMAMAHSRGKDYDEWGIYNPIFAADLKKRHKLLLSPFSPLRPALNTLPAVADVFKMTASMTYLMSSSGWSWAYNKALEKGKGRRNAGIKGGLAYIGGGALGVFCGLVGGAINVPVRVLTGRRTELVSGGIDLAKKRWNKEKK